MADLNEDVKRPPQSEEAEQAVLGGLMLESRHLDDVIDILSAEDFHIHTHRSIFRAIKNVAEDIGAADAVTVSDHLSNNGELEGVGGIDYLRRMVDNTPTVAHIKDYARIVRDRSVLRRLIETTTDISARAYQPDGMSPLDILDDAEQKIYEISDEHGKHAAGLVHLERPLSEAVNRIDQASKNESHITGISTGFKELDEMTSGLQKGDLIIIAGRPSMGKTALAMNIVTNAAIREKKSVAVFSIETPGRDLAVRMLSSISHVNCKRLFSGRLSESDYDNKIGPAISLLNTGPIFIDDTGRLSPLDVRSRVRRLVREKKIQLDMIVVDYLQLMSSSETVRGENRVTEIARMTRSLKILAKEMDVPVVVLSQLSRAARDRTDKRPIMSDLRESGAIEQDADLILFLHREDEIPEDGKMDLLIAKHRNGPVGELNLVFLREYVRFDNYAPDVATMDVGAMH